MKGVSVETGRKQFFIHEKNKSKSPVYMIYLFKTGSGIHVINGVEYKLSQSSIHFVAPGDVQYFKNLKTDSGYCITFTEDFVFSNSEHKDVLFKLPFFSYELRHSKQRLDKKVFEKVFVIASIMQQEIKSKKPFSEKIVLSCLNLLILLSLNFTGNENIRSLPKRPGNAYTRIDSDHYTSLEIAAKYKKLVNRFFMEEHSVAFYASKMAFTPDYLYKVVKCITGLTPVQVIQERIIRESKYLLIHSNQSPKEVGTTLGFADHSHFTKFFKKYAGQTPLVWFNNNK